MSDHQTTEPKDTTMNAPLERLRMEKSTATARSFARQYEAGELLIDAPYQRGSVWTTQQRQGLIRSFMLGLPIPGLILNDRWNAEWVKENGERDARQAVVDGRQRVETILAWFAGDLAVPASWFHPEQVATTTDGPDGAMVTYKGLSEAGQRHVALEWTIQAAVGRVDTLAGEADIYLLVNSAGTSQTDADLDNARQYL